ncbi:MAG TPA: nucleoside recognition domain-containing protein [Verrucomicrobiales bacterium]|jgi:spore maturation protein SpmA/spore maturation protein SpmB|nr:nucleoside recognition domain-containing protein [Verrucomicrobiales bacterium]
MLNWIWLIMMTVSVAVALLLGKIEPVTRAVFKKCEVAVMDLMLPLGGAIVLWMGLMRLIERSGLIVIVGKLIAPVMRRLYPDIPANHPAHASIALNLGASMLGGGNAATPLGLRAMSQMNSLNPNPGVATNSMCLFLAMNSCAITLIPATTIALLQAKGATKPMGVILPALLTTVVATIAGVLAAKLMQRMGAFRAQPVPAEELPAAQEKKEEYQPVQPKRLKGWQRALMVLWFLLPLVTGVFFVWFPDRLAEMQSSLWNALGLKGEVPWVKGLPGDPLGRAVSFFSIVTVPVFVGFCVLFAAMQGLKVYEELVEGGRDGMQTVLRVIPYVVAMLVALGMFTESGALALLENALRPVLGLVGFPVEVLPMAIVRPLSAGAARGVLDELATTHQPDSLITMIAATINGSTETTFYVAAVYFGSVGIKRMRHAVAAGLVADAVAMFSAVLFCWLFY